MVAEKRLASLPEFQRLAAVSAGIVGGEVLLDLDYPEDANADADGNFVMAGGQWVEIQVTAETTTISDEQFEAVKEFAAKGIDELLIMWDTVA